ncbi:MAG: helicase HerA-like domain-containing protein [Fodinibius sp.]|nr:helicase HerA-like domain-containing protein [Fodinibius sp.]
MLISKDIKQILRYAIGDGNDTIEEHYGHISESSVSTILRKVIELEHQGADRFFGERSFDVNDLLRTNAKGHGVISVIRLTDIQDQPKLFSTFMLCLLAEVYSRFPEEGDLDKPKLALFIDEAHLIFDEASKALLSQIETIVKLIRSKGVGIFFCTQNPTDIPDTVLGQLGLKVQHALRAFTARDQKMIAKTAENYPLSDFYETAKVLTSLGIGEALVTALNEKGIPTPLAATLLRAPCSQMGVLERAEIQEVVSQSHLVPLYNQSIDRQSAYEILTEKLVTAKSNTPAEEPAIPTDEALRTTFESLSKNTMMRQVGRTMAREITRGLLGVLGISRR